MIKAIMQYFIISKSGLFDRYYYLKTYRDVRRSDVDPLWHFIRHGWKEGRNPSNDFNISFYLENNIDVKKSGINPLIHFIRFGKKEGRSQKAGVKADLGKFHFDLEENENKPLIPVFNEEILQNKPKQNIDELLHKNIKIAYPSLEIADEIQADIEEHQEKISIIIPTKNAGNDFEFLMKMLWNQVGFSDIEIVIVDSGSQDSTIQIAKDYNAKVIEIPPDDFSHSYARNLGAKNASGEYYLFTVQDALPPTNTWLNTLMTTLKNEDVSAVSCAELPREDADLFYRVISWNHYEFLDVNKHDRILSMPDEPNHINLRKNGQLSDLACLIPAELFNKYHYRFSYAEDLDLGLRLIRDGHKIAFLGSTRIIHSHNRPAFYFLKRGFVDNIFLSDIFSDFKIPETDFSAAAQDIAFIYHFINSQILKVIDEYNPPIDLLMLKSNIVESINSAETLEYPQQVDFDQNNYVGKELSEFIERLLAASGYEKAGLNYDGRLAKSLLGFVNMTFQYLQRAHDSIDEKLVLELSDCLFKQASILSGANLAYAYLGQTEEERNKHASIYSTLRESV